MDANKRELERQKEEHAEHLEKVTEDRIGGLPPSKSLNLELYSGESIPIDWEIVGVTGDILMVEYADCDDNNENVMRDGILVPLSARDYVWRVGQIIKAGPGASEQAQPVEGEDKYVLFPYDRGIPMTKFNGHNYVFLNEQRVFGFVKPKEELKNPLEK